jgi:hypothetical protein
MAKAKWKSWLPGLLFWGLFLASIALALSVGGHGLVFRLDDIPGTGIHFQRC